MSPTSAAIVIVVAAYLVGAIPFGYLLGRLNGVNLFRAGSGNIGATNLGRTVGRPWGVAAFVLDFLKGALPTAFALRAATVLHPDAGTAFGFPDVLTVAAGAAAFLGHLFPIYLGFHGGKGVATGAGVVAVLVPGPTAVGVLVWVTVLLATRYISAASVVAAAVIMVARLVSVPGPFAEPGWVVTAFVLAAATFVVVKHRANIVRILAGTESRIDDAERRVTLLKAFHVVAVGWWFGAAAFFNYMAALPIFASFAEVVKEQPNNRTAQFRILPDSATGEDQKALGSALAGAAVAPLFPRYFLLAALCSMTAVVTAHGFRRMAPASRLHRRRFWLAVAAGLLVACGWPLSEEVARLSVNRWSANPELAASAKAAFGPWHLASLMSSGLTTLLAGVLLLLAAKLPEYREKAGERGT